MEELFFEDELTAAERDEWREERERKAAERSRRERVWQVKHPAEWEEWNRVRLLLNGPIPFGDDAEFDFEEFLKEVGRCPSTKHDVVRLDETKPYQPGNLIWAAQAAEPPKSPYLNVEQAAAYLGVAVQTIYNNSKHIPRLPGFWTLMYDPKTLEQVRASERFKTKRLAANRKRQARQTSRHTPSPTRGGTTVEVCATHGGQ
jgi:hypothetical protein